jgi:hypothetical protein
VITHPYWKTRPRRVRPSGFMVVAMVLFLLAAAALFFASSSHHGLGSQQAQPVAAAQCGAHAHDGESVPDHHHHHGNDWTPRLNQRAHLVAQATVAMTDVACDVAVPVPTSA